MGLGKLVMIPAIALAASATSAQTQPDSTTAPGGVTVSSPRWNAPETNSYPLAGVDNLVTQTVMGVAQARADATAAEWMFRKANQDLNLASTFLQKDFRESEEFDKAFTEFQTAYDEYEAARTKALAGLRGDEKYRAAASLRNNVSDQITDEHAQKQPDTEKLVSLAGLKIDSIASFRDQERDTLAADQNVVAARQRLITAGKNLAKVERDFARRARNDGGLAELRRAREEAKIAKLASAVYYAGLKDAQDIALRYAWRARYWDRYVPRLTDYNYGYGYGNYGYGYPGYGVRYPAYAPGVVRVSTTSAPFHNNTAGGLLR